MESLVVVSLVTLTSFRTSSSLLTASLRSPVAGMVSFAFGTSLLAPLLVALLDTLKMCCLLPSPLTTARSSLPPGTAPSSSGTLLVSASTPSKTMMLTLIGLAV
uniref:Uncharacterized protein n=1 Tax=Opuntia streptacantha TaxID=393608 RepID=A0A7C8YM74_OPUST